MRVMALDQSLVCTGVAIASGSDIIHGSIMSKFKGIKRLVDIRSQILDYIAKYNVKILLMEEYAFAAKGHTYSLGELGGMIKLFCYQNDIPLFVMPIATHKIFTTGKGNSKKDIMLKEVYKKYEIDVDNDNEADAISILKTFLAFIDFEYNKADFTINQKRAIDKVSKLAKSDSKLMDAIRKRENVEEIVYV